MTPDADDPTLALAVVPVRRAHRADRAQPTVRADPTVRTVAA